MLEEGPVDPELLKDPLGFREATITGPDANLSYAFSLKGWRPYFET